MIQPLPKPQYRLMYFWHHDDCDVCRQAEPIFDAWVKTLPPMYLNVIKLNATYHQFEKYGWNPKGTPAYMLTINSEPVWKFVGGLGLKQLKQLNKEMEKWQA